MPTTASTTGTGGTPGGRSGAIAGHALRLIRERLALTREAAAEALHVDIDTIKSWETGRRPLANIKVSALNTLVRRLRHHGAEPDLLELLHTAIDTDLFVAHVLTDPNIDPADHILASWVSTRAWNDLLAWLLAGTAPKPLTRLIIPGQRRGPAPVGPELTASDRVRFFDAIRTTADRATAANTDPAAVLLRRQLYFLAAWDETATGRDWLARAERAEVRHLRSRAGWTPTWVASRSLAVARARQGDPEQLRRFIDNQLADDDLCEAANLNYWAYWIGEQPGAATRDDFMAADLGTWRGTALLRHLTDGLHAGTPYLELSIHSVWSLLARRPHLLDDDAGLTGDLTRRVAALLDGDIDLSPQARRELDQIRFLTRTRRSGR